MRVLLCIISMLILSYKGLCCTCTEKNAVEKEVGVRDLIIKGKVISIDTLFSVDTIKYREIKSKEDYSTFHGLQYIVKVAALKAYKGGTTGDTVSIVTGLGGGDCGFTFEVGSEYFIYANSTSKAQVDNADLRQKRRVKRLPKKILVFETHICTRTAIMNKKEEQEINMLLNKNGS